jgi:hypothetical protein
VPEENKKMIKKLIQKIQARLQARRDRRKMTEFFKNLKDFSEQVKFL